MLLSRRMLRVVVAASLLLLTPARARADVESERVRAGVAAFQHLEYERAAKLLEPALAESLTREEKIVAYRTLGFCYVVLDRPVAARKSFARLLTIDPASDLDSRVSPRVRAVFEEARADVAQQGRSDPSLHRLPELKPTVDPAAPRTGDALTLTLVHPGGLARRAELFYRTRGMAAFSRIVAPVDDAGRATPVVPGPAVAAPALQYYAVVLDDAGTAIARAGNLTAPLELAVRVRPVALYKRRWFWGVIGGVAGVLVVGAVTTAAVLSTPATVTLNPR